MPRPIVVVGNNTKSGWYSVERLKAEGPYEDIAFSETNLRYMLGEGPLAGTKIDSTPLWCAVLEGKLIVAPRTSDKPPPPISKQMQVRGFYELDAELVTVVWRPIGAPWDENEIGEYRLLSNPAYLLYEKVPVSPEHVFFFGAGASYGSDMSHLYKRGELPPLGKDLFEELMKTPDLKHWHLLPKEVLDLFQSRPFEEAMNELYASKSGATGSFGLDLELSLFFSKYRPYPSNLYWKLAKRIARRLKGGAWTSAVITLNYERLLEESFMRNAVFTVVKGITFYDDPLPPLRDNQLFEICYPHGGCQFFMSQSFFEGEGEVVFGDEARMNGNVGANHILNQSNIIIVCRSRQIPLICRYQSSKRPSIKNYFVDTQKSRCQELILNAKKITIIGVQCLFPGDSHFWEPLGLTKGFIIYVEPGEASQERFREWGRAHHKIEGEHYRIISKTFKDAFESILQFNQL